MQFKKPSRTTRNKDVRTREHLSEKEVIKLAKALRQGTRYPDRNECLILMMFKHGLRASEVINVRWDQIDFSAGLFHVNRLKGSIDTSHPLTGDVLRLLRRLERQDNKQRYVFVNERGSPIGYQAVYSMVRRIEEEAGFDFPIHPHMLRHSCGFYLANKGTDTRTIQHYMGHAHISNTVRYTHLDANRFKALWD